MAHGLLILPEDNELQALLSGDKDSTSGIWPVEGQRLAWLASIANSPIVEIGSHRGKSTCYLACGSRAGGGQPVFAVDLWELGADKRAAGYATYDHYHDVKTWELFCWQTASMGVTDLVHPVKMESTKAAKRRRNPIGLLFIDADHRYKYAKRDYDAWQHFVPVGGWLAMHDYTPRYGVKRLVDEVIMPSGCWAEERVDGRLWSAKRVRR